VFLNFGCLIVNSADDDLQKLKFNREIMDEKRIQQNENQELTIEIDRARDDQETRHRIEQAKLEKAHSKKRKELLDRQQEIDRLQKVLHDERTLTDELHKKEREELVDRHSLETMTLQEEIKAQRQLLSDHHQKQLKDIADRHEAAKLTEESDEE
jgi:hypothetical protein